MALGWSDFQRAMDGCEGTVRAMPDGEWGAPSPCPGWRARDVADHLIAEVHWAATLVAGGEVSDGIAAASDPVGTPLEAWRSARDRLDQACTPDALGRHVAWPFGEQTVDRGLGLFSLEVLVHTWDIAQAGRLDITLDAGLVHDHLMRVQRIGHLLRGPGMYGPELPPPPGADEPRRLLALLGRQG